MKKTLLLIPILATSLLVNCGSNGPKKYKITWRNYNDDLLDSEIYNEGDTPTYKKGTPEQASQDPQYQYTFTGWDPAIREVKEDKTYKATYIKETAKYTVTWKNGDNTDLGKQIYKYGEIPSYPKDWELPTKKGDAQWEKYTFRNEWLPKFKPIKGDITYIPQFRGEGLKKHTVKWVNDDGSTIKQEDVEYGKIPTYHKDWPIPKSTKKPKDEDFYYAFSHWDKEPSKVEGPQTYIACYKEVEWPITYLKVNFPESPNSLELSFKCEGELGSIDWGDKSTIDAKKTSHVYANAGLYDIKVRGLLTSFSCLDASDNGNQYITNISLDSHINTIPNEAFCFCSSLTLINIPNSVTSIGELAFNKCDSLRSINIPSNVTSLGSKNYPNPFSDCPTLNTITVANDNPKYTSGAKSTNAIIEKATNTLVVGCNATIIPNGVKIIGKHAFDSCCFEMFDIPTGVETIGDCAFFDCIKLVSITLPNTIRLIGDQAFYSCTKLNSFKIPTTVEKVSNNAFDSCTSLTEIYIPINVTTMGCRVFDGCSKLAKIDCQTKEPGPIGWDKEWHDGCSAKVNWEVNPPTI